MSWRTVIITGQAKLDYKICNINSNINHKINLLNFTPIRATAFHPRKLA